MQQSRGTEEIGILQTMVPCKIKKEPTKTLKDPIMLLHGSHKIFYKQKSLFS